MTSSDDFINNHLWLIVGLAGGSGFLLLLVPILLLGHCMHRKKQATPVVNPFLQRSPSASWQGMNRRESFSQKMLLKDQQSAQQSHRPEKSDHKVATNTATYELEARPFWKPPMQQNYVNQVDKHDTPQPAWSGASGQQYTNTYGVGEPQQQEYPSSTVNQNVKTYDTYSNPLERADFLDDPVAPVVSVPEVAETENIQPLRRRNSRVSFVGEFRT
ncbi:hypothetical protein TRVL_00931 [Trypanosoma vivax]|nr:hypothetical protein TRVL_00931 [Trypanosoma vivax]